MIENIAENSVLIAIGLLATAGFGGIVGYFNKRTNCLKTLAGDIEELNKRSYRIEKAMIILAKLQEDVIERTHPELKTEWEDIVKELLHGNGHRT
jgi:hypothetical protein